MSVLVLDQLDETLHRALREALGGDELVLRIPEGDLLVGPMRSIQDEIDADPRIGEAILAARKRLDEGQGLEIDPEILSAMVDADEDEIPLLMARLRESAKPYTPGPHL
ncbi:hypothetical protein BH11ARM2_BH11ARM2_23110 [soil metagenome]